MSKLNKEEKQGEFTLTADILVLDEIALGIKQISGVFKKMNQGPLNRRGLVVLLKDAIGSGNITSKQINQVLDAAEKLDDYLIKPKG
jgi:hypothetical protein